MFVSTRVVIVDEHDAVRAGVGSWLAEQHLGLKVVADFARPRKYLRWLTTNRQSVDVLVTEIQEDGHCPDLDCLRELCAAGPAVVVYSRLTADEVILSSIDVGARCYLAKAGGSEHLLAALTDIGAGRAYVGPHMSGALERGRTLGRPGLSDREKEVLRAWLLTDRKDDVAEALHISSATVRTHLQRLRSKYATVGRPAPSKSALLARAIEDGIIGLSDLDPWLARRPKG